MDAYIYVYREREGERNPLDSQPKMPCNATIVGIILFVSWNKLTIENDTLGYSNLAMNFI